MTLRVSPAALAACLLIALSLLKAAALAIADDQPSGTQSAVERSEPAGGAQAAATDAGGADPSVNGADSSDATANDEAKAESPEVDKAVQVRFDAAFSAFKQNVGRLRTLVGEYQLASSAEKVRIQGEFDRLVAETKPIADQLLAAAEPLYGANPKNTEVGDLLFLMLEEAVQTDHCDAAQRVAKLLIDGEYPNKRIYELAGTAAYGDNDFAHAKTLFNKAMRANTLEKSSQKLLRGCDENAALWEQEKKIRAAEAEADDLPRVKLTTTKGDIVLELFENEAPNTTANFISLVEKHFYDGLLFHRVIGGFMAQGGDPSGNGSGGPGYTIECECYQPSARKHFGGSLSMAHAGRDTGGSQFFLTFAPAANLNGKHTVFGRIVEGQDVLADLQRIEPGKPGTADKIVSATVLRKRDHKYEPVTRAPAAPR